ncbi:hypothetical protein [Martelella mangrovi]|uniref:hypothetical protein n=1 Tax=Martelella mangrovi TaxID=1397477 RepID=UPI003396E283
MRAAKGKRCQDQENRQACAVYEARLSGKRWFRIQGRLVSGSMGFPEQRQCLQRLDQARALLHEPECPVSLGCRCGKLQQVGQADRLDARNCRFIRGLRTDEPGQDPREMQQHAITLAKLRQKLQGGNRIGQPVQCVFRVMQPGSARGIKDPGDAVDLVLGFNENLKTQQHGRKKQ